MGGVETGSTEGPLITIPVGQPFPLNKIYANGINYSPIAGARSLTGYTIGVALNEPGTYYFQYMAEFVWTDGTPAPPLPPVKGIALRTFPEVPDPPPLPSPDELPSPPPPYTLLPGSLHINLDSTPTPLTNPIWGATVAEVKAGEPVYVVNLSPVPVSVTDMPSLGNTLLFGPYNHRRRVFLFIARLPN
jgi:hypothetical protein